MSSTISKVKQKFKKPNLSFWAIWNMNFGFFGIQFSFALQQSNMSFIYKSLGASEHELPLLWLAGPVTGLLVQPIIGVMSDGTWSNKWGRRKPYFLIGAIAASIALILMPFSSAVWMAASLLWILDAGNNIALEPYRAFVADILPKKQYSLGFLMQSFFSGLGSTLANFMPAILVGFGILALDDTFENGIPVFTYYAFFIGAAASIITVLISVFSTKEYPPTEEEWAKIQKDKAKGNIYKRVFGELGHAFKEMPAIMKQLIPVKFFSWFALFIYWQFLTSVLALTQFGIPLERINDTEYLNDNPAYKSASVLTSALNGSYNIICFLIAFALVPVAIRLGAKYVHAIALLLGGLSLWLIPLLSNDVIYFQIGENFAVTETFLYTLGFGISWASMLSMPYQMLAGSIPKEKMGVYMGIFNMFIVIPMIIQIFCTDLFLFELLGSNPVNMYKLAGTFLLIAAVFSIFVKTNTLTKEENTEIGGGGGH